VRDEDLPDRAGTTPRQVLESRVDGASGGLADAERHLLVE
jgi:hypothetical protein